MSEQGFRIHLLVADPHGAVVSAPGGTAFRVGTRSRWHVACDPQRVLSAVDRGTTEPWAVRCPECCATAAFQAIDRPRPVGVESPAESVS